MSDRENSIAEEVRLAETRSRQRYWTRFGTYLAERNWGTVREDYSKDGECWDDFPHEMATSRAYRFGEDGLLGICDRQGRLCFAPALWNGKDPILKERLFGLNGKEGNHGEDVKEIYQYLDATPTMSYAKAFYRYPLDAFPYEQLRKLNQEAGRERPEVELEDTGIFDGNRFVDLIIEYAKNDPDDVLIRLKLVNHSFEPAKLHLLGQFWFRNHWSWGRSGEGFGPKPALKLRSDGTLSASHFGLGRYRIRASRSGMDIAGAKPTWLFTENETNAKKLYGSENASPYVKDAFHEYLIHGAQDAVNPEGVGTKAAAVYAVEVPARGALSFGLRLTSELLGDCDPMGDDFDAVFEQRIADAEEFYAEKIATEDLHDREIARLANAGLLWSKQFYHFVVDEWLEGDPLQPKPPKERARGRNRDWRHLYNRDIILMPDKWEYPWYAAWDLAFHAVAVAHVDLEFAKSQLSLLLREWYMHPSGQIPAYEFEFSDVNPPVHAWAVWRVYKMSGKKGHRDRAFLESCFHKLLLNFTWWVNRKDVEGNHLFAGGFLGLDNIGVFDRSKLPIGSRLEQADGTAWMAFYCGTMLAISLELAQQNPSYEDLASKFFEHFVAIASAINTFGGSGLFDEGDGFYYDRLRLGDHDVPLKVRSLVGLVPLFAVEVIEEEHVMRLRGFMKRMKWFLRERVDLARQISYMEHSAKGERYLLAIPSLERLVHVLRYALDETEFLSPFGIRSLSRVHADKPFRFEHGNQKYGVEYMPGESNSGLFGGNSNWRGPVWFPMNFLFIEALERWHYFYGDALVVECPVGSGRMLDLRAVAQEISMRLVSLFRCDGRGKRPCHGAFERYADDPAWNHIVFFHEYFHGDTGKGLGASHQTGWTALVVRLLEKLSRS